MDGGDGRRPPLWKNLKRRLGLKGMMGFCGSCNWVLDDDVTAGVEPLMTTVDQSPPPCIGETPAADGTTTMSLATALASDRQQIPTNGVKIKPLKSLMRLFEEIDGHDLKDKEEGNGSGAIDTVYCSLCMERNQGAAVIPCGHTYCRICCRDVWVRQMSCPQCNRPITDILDIF